MGPVHPLDRPIGRLLRIAQAASPQDVVEAVAMSVAEVDGSDLVLFLLDYEQATLRPHSDRLPHPRPPEPVSADGSMVGRCFSTQTPLAVERDNAWRVWVPVTERVDRLGVLEFALPAWDDEMEEFCVELGLATAHLVLAASRYTDQIHLLRRRQDMSLAAEMQWSLLPPLAFGVGTTTIAGLLEPTYDVGGDCFDYALNGNVLDLAVFDAMGHGVGSAMLSSLAVGAYRNGRRNSDALSDVVAEIDEAVQAHTDGGQFVTGLMARLDIGSGMLSWFSAGHPAPIQVRRGRSLAESESDPGMPLGLGGFADRPRTGREIALQPGDAVLFYTDGVVDARSATGEFFGEQRLRDLLGREAASGRSPTEVLRRLVHAAITYQGARLRDDASMLYLQWDGTPDEPITGRR
jgi:serine phosphatase RsbU (regulator of sigma subunit)